MSVEVGQILGRNGIGHYKVRCFYIITQWEDGHGTFLGSTILCKGYKPVPEA